MSLFSRLFVLAFFVVAGCGQSPEMKELQDSITKTAEQVDQETAAVKKIKDNVSKQQKDYEAKVEELCDQASDDLKGFVKDHGKLVKEIKELSTEMSAISAQLSALPDKLNENMRFSIKLIREDYENHEKRAEEITKDAEKIEKKSSKYDEKITQLMAPSQSGAENAQ